MTTAPNIRAIMRSNYVQRYHANPDLARYGDTVGHHQAMVAQILFALHPSPSMALIHAALHHDCGEAGVGDMPGPLKHKNPLLANLMETVEREQLAGMGIAFSLSDQDQDWLDFADRLAAYIHVRHVAPHILDGDGWPDALTRLQIEADRLGIVGFRWAA